MRLVFLLFMVTMFCSCSNDSSHSLSNSDSLVIQFNGVGSESISKTVSTTDKNAIDKLVQFVDDGKSEEHKCSNEGSLVFYKGGTLLKEIQFAYLNDSCKRFYWEEEQITHDVKMSNEAADFLKRLAEGKNWY